MRKIKNAKWLFTLPVGTKFKWNGKRYQVQQNDGNGLSAERLGLPSNELEAICFNNDHLVEVIV